MSDHSPDASILPPEVIQPQTVEDMGNRIQKLTFPDGFACYALSSPTEATFIYNEIIAKQEYFQQGLTVAKARCVLDVGANIGIFTMAVKLQAPEAAVYAFEPIPETFQVLEQNVRLLGSTDVHLYNLAIGAEDEAEKTFTFFANMPGNSTAIPALKTEQKPALEQALGKAAADFFYQSETRTAQVRTLSAFIREQGITQVDYLKIDVEGSEISVLHGIEASHWPIFQQVTIETHSAQLHQQVCELLAQAGFEVYTALGLSAVAGGSLVYGKR